MSDLVEFLLSRIAEDYADAMSGWRWKSLPTGEYERLQARVLAECEAKKAIVEIWEIYEYEVTNAHGYDDVLKTLALPYADHPDFDEAWRP